MRQIARGLNHLTGGRLNPHAVTLIGLAAHLPIAWLIGRGSFGWAAGLLVFFGLFDTLDGELARLQRRVSRLGMLLDSVSDRMKEAVLYMGIGYYLIESALSEGKDASSFAVLALAALGGSMLVSYVNAWGEVVTAGVTNKSAEVNRAFRIGLMKFEVRMTLIVIGLLFNWLAVMVFVIALLAWLTAVIRLLNVRRQLS